MLELLVISHYVVILLLIVLPASCVALSQGYAAQAALDATDMQPQSSRAITGMLLFGSALSETAALLSCIMGAALLLLNTPLTWPIVGVEIGIACAIGIPASFVGILSFLPHKEAMFAIARQPFNAPRMSYFIAFVLSMMQVSVVLGLLLSFVLKAYIVPTLLWQDSLKLAAVGVAFGCGTIGPLIGMSIFTSTACSVMGKYPDAYNSIVSFSFVSQALIETPILFALFVALCIMIKTSEHPIAPLGAAIAIALSTFGPGIASGLISGAACKSIGLIPERAAFFSYSSVFAQTFVDVAVIYGVIIAIGMLW